MLSIIEPEDEFELDETDIINLKVQIDDDYGVSRLWIEYKIKKPSYIEYQDTNTYIHEINEFNNNCKRK